MTMKEFKKYLDTQIDIIENEVSNLRFHCNAYDPWLAKRIGKLDILKEIREVIKKP